MSDIYDWATCDHRGIGQIGCPTCDADPARVRIRREREEVQRLRAEVERLTRELTSANQSRDYLEALLAEREERVRRLEKERDALKAALRDIDEAVGICVSHGWTAGVRHRHLDPALQRAREALKGGGK